MIGLPGRLCPNQRYIERVRDPARDLVLQREQVADVAVEALGPEMRVGRGVDQLGVDANPVLRSLDTAFQHVTHAELTADLFRVDRFAR